MGLRRHGSAELAITHAQWGADRYDMAVADGARFEMYVYVDDLDATVTRLTESGVRLLRAAQDMPWGERIATVADPAGNPVSLCQQRPA